MATFRSVEDIEVWQKARELTREIYKHSNQGLFAKDFGLRDQIRRASISITSNIAEGFARQHQREYQQFCYIALGSCAELETQVIIAERQGFLPSIEAAELRRLIDVESRMIMSLIKRLRERAASD